MKKIFILLIAIIMIFSMSACSGKSEVKEAALDLEAMYEAISAKMPEMIVLDEAMMLDFCGIDAKSCEKAIVAISDNGLLTDEVWLIKAVDEKAITALKELAQSRLKAKGDESITYSPEQYAVVQKAQIIEQGSYIFVLVSPDVEELSKICNEYIG